MDKFCVLEAPAFRLLLLNSNPGTKFRAFEILVFKNYD